MRYFFYGTLMDPAVLAAVIGRRPPPALWAKATIEGYRRVFRAGTRYPILIPAPGERVDGMLVGGLGARDARRLDIFEGRDYAARTVLVQARLGGRIPARIFMPKPGVPATARPWTPEDWRRRHRRTYLARVRCTRKPRGPNTHL